MNVAMNKRNYTGPERVKQARQRREQEPIERMKSMMVWMAYAGIVAWGLFLRAAGLM